MSAWEIPSFRLALHFAHKRPRRREWSSALLALLVTLGAGAAWVLFIYVAGWR